MNIGRIRLLTSDGQELARFGPERLVPMHSIVSVSMAGGVARVTTAADTPMLFVARPLQLETESALGRRFVGSAQLLALWFLVALLIGFSAFTAARSLIASSAGATWALVGTFLVVFGARLYNSHFGNPLPYWDEWETDAIDLLIPLRGGFLDWQALFIPQGEHRILVTRLLNLVGTLINGEWDPRVGMTVGALFTAEHALLCVGALKAGPRSGLIAGFAIAIWSCLPFDMQNIYWNIQSQMYALNLLAVCTLAIAVSARTDSLTWCGACASGLVSLFTMGSGFLAPAVASVICIARLRGAKENRLSVGILGALFLASAVIGICMYRDAPFQGGGYARTWEQFLPSFISRSAWPFPAALGWTVFLWIPWLVASVLAVYLRRAPMLIWFAVGVGAWALLNTVGLAHGRPSDPRPFDTKYFTAMSLVIAASVLSSSALMSRWPAHRMLTAALLAISLATVAAMQPIAAKGIQGSREQSGARQANEALVRAYLATGNPAPLRETPYWELPYWNGAELADLLDSPSLQPLLPAEIRASLAQRDGSRVHEPQSPGIVSLSQSLA